MAMIDGMLQELEQEAQTTRRVLERVPDDQLAWRPHEKARTLGELALHVATVPGARRAARSSQSPAQAPTVQQTRARERGGADPGARREHRQGQERARRNGRRDARWRRGG